MTCQMPGAAWQKVWRRPLGSNVGSAVAAKTTPEVPMVAETEPGARMPMPTAPAPWSPAPATTGVPGWRPVAAAPSGEMRAQISGPSKSCGSHASGFLPR